ncbi:hypothetical protein [Hyphomicrobium sp.]|uniref:hypothetical protein n=1 Tax=Hyphomicrobium sp. TaxID=82 RepID=UPI002E351AC5|nr:hypothetical protein [Hyphomicrobium sp.]HEX2843246.1 hypothetical protein [Hyphomicrobium sp.]
MKELKLYLIMLTAPLVLLFALAQLRADYALYRQVRDYGLPATAIVRSIDLASYIGRTEGGRKVNYVLDLPGPAMVNGSAHMSKRAADRYSPGQEIEIVYAETNPSLNALSVAHAWGALVSDAIVIFAYGAVLALVIALIRTAPRRAWRGRTLSIK